MEELISKYINNELKREEWEVLRVWLNQSRKNKKLFTTLVSYASYSESEIREIEGPVWEDLKHKRLKQDKLPRSPLSFYYLKIAAIILFVSSLSFLAYELIEHPEEEKVVISIIERNAPVGSKLTTRLPDGSIVTLNSGSTITFPEHFDEIRRDVSLEGEAFFEVQHDKEKPFFVNLRGDQVRVLGTSFNIRSYPEDNVVSVSVASGKVAYKIPSGKEVILQANESSTYLIDQDNLLTGAVDMKQAFGWKESILYFKGSSFNDIVEELRRWYGVEFEITGDFQNIGTYTGEFSDPTLAEVLNSLSFVYRFTFSISNNKVIIKENENMKSQ